MQLGVAHGPFDPQEQAVVVLGRIIDAILVDDERIGQATDLDETIPVAAGTSQARGFQAEDGADTAEPDLGHQVLEAVASEGGGPGVALVLVDDVDAFLGPSELLGAASQVVLAGGAGDVVADLHGGRLPDIDQGLAVEMLGADLEGSGSWWHGADSCVGRFLVLGEEMGGQVGHESDGAGLGIGGEPVPDLGGRDHGDGKRLLAVHKNTSPIDTGDVGSMGMILSRVGRVRGGEVDVAGRRATLARDAIEEQADLTEPVEIEEVIRPGRGLAVGRGGIVRAAHGDGGMVPVRESDDEIGIEPSAELDDLDLLSAERVMRMGDGDESRRGLG